MKGKQAKYAVFPIAVVLMLFASWARGQGLDYQNLPPPKLEPPPEGTAATSPATQAGDTAQAGKQPAAPERPLPSISLEARVEKPKAARDETVRLMITLSWEEPAGLESLPLDFEFPEPPAAEGLLAVANTFKSETTLEGDKVKVKRIYTYEFTPQKTGKTVIQPVVIRAFRIGSENKTEFKTQPLSVEIVKPPFRVSSFLKSTPAKLILAALAAAAAALLGWSMWKSREKEEPLPAAAKSIHEQARDRLKQADRLRLAGDYPGFMTALNALIRDYARDALGIKAKPGDTEDFTEAVAEKLGPEWRERLRALEKLADRIKFAGYKPASSELDQSLETAAGIIEAGERKQGITSEQNQEMKRKNQDKKPK